MPHYEFFCHDCKRLFSKILSLVDYEKGHVASPKCGSKNVEQRWSAYRHHIEKERVKRAGS
jgi:putative FmdB family regulatory protein